VLPAPAPRAAASTVPTSMVKVAPRQRVTISATTRDDDIATLSTARSILCVGAGVAPDEYPTLTPLIDALGAELAATRKVTDKGWQPRARQIGITGRSVAPRLYVGLGLSGKFNHMVGVRAAGTVLAVNRDEDALVWEHADIGITGDWHDVVPLLTDAIERLRP
jgi:electron transfer flavoprotein alpha subunit